MQIAILDGYIDEPACLGVPPYIAPQIRSLAGAITKSGSDYIYLTIDEYRNNSPKCKSLSRSDALVVVAGAVVPGKYIGGSPISYREAKEVVNRFSGSVILGGPAGWYGFFNSKTGVSKKVEGNLYDHQCEGDIDACIYDLLNKDRFSDRKHTLADQNEWSVAGAPVIKQHPNYPDRLIAEIESYRGCTRYHTGGCSFCIEPGYGKPDFRKPEDIINEVKQLKENGLNNYRLGAQSCIYSYLAKGVGTRKIPEPNPPEIKKLLSGLRSVIGEDGLLHVDNANPAVLAEYPEESSKITKYLVD